MLTLRTERDWLREHPTLPHPDRQHLCPGCVFDSRSRRTVTRLVNRPFFVFLRGQTNWGGGFATCHLVTEKQTMTDYAAKIIYEKLRDASSKKAEEKSQRASKGQPASADKEPDTKLKQDDEQKPTKPDGNEENGDKVKSKDESPQPGQESKPKAGNETDSAKPVPKTSEKSISGEEATDSKSKEEPKEEDKPIQGNDKPGEGVAEGEEPKLPGEETGPSRNATKTATKAAEAEEDRRTNKIKGEEEVEDVHCIKPVSAGMIKLVSLPCRGAVPDAVRDIRTLSLLLRQL
ncbi:hypothetical protein HPB49_004075 [Dermacentor silvarum]|uniref:Uncharacterized protein n=1 Tax=Dermacentor silvarum TaxID=543639 RepID=A0ACB8DAU8_DERSI|nr:hypothetical protein HPB49_004075 [Dermacentor silvarum]